jgi:GNAT superfamily N-acetyltransferase
MGKITLIASHGPIDYVPGGRGRESSTFTIKAFTQSGKQVGWVNFEEINSSLEAVDLVVDPAHRRQGIATELYRFAKELGNSISPSSKQTPDGKAFWRGAQIDENFDVCRFQLHGVVKHLLQNNSLLENSDDQKNISAFLRLHYSAPKVGESYCPISILAIPSLKIIDAAFCPLLVECVDVEDDRVYFNINDKVCVFPDNSELSSQMSVLLESPREMEHFLTLLSIKFGPWNLKVRDYYKSRFDKYSDKGK